MNTVFALSNLVIKELYRRKDFYVLLVLTFGLTLFMASVHFFHDPKIVLYVKMFCLVLIWISALVITIVTTARQIPAEQENRTIFPLLAKPVSRWQVVVGKFLGCWLASGIALFVFYLFFVILSGSREGQWRLPNYFQGFWLQWSMLAVVVAGVLFGSVLFSAPSANVTISFVVVATLLFLGGHLDQVAAQQVEPLRTIAYVIYNLIPHLEWYDIRGFLVYNNPLVPWSACLAATAYAAVYALLLLFLTWLRFKRKALTT